MNVEQLAEPFVDANLVLTWHVNISAKYELLIEPTADSCQ